MPETSLLKSGPACRLNLPDPFHYYWLRGRGVADLSLVSLHRLGGEASVEYRFLLMRTYGRYTRADISALNEGRVPGRRTPTTAVMALLDPDGGPSSRVPGS